MHKIFAIGLAVTFLGSAGLAAAPAAARTFGWRGNWTGLYPEADPPVEWGRISTGVVAGMSCQAAPPGGESTKSGQPVKDGFINDWLVSGPYPVTDSLKDFDAEQLPNEASLRPAEGEKWKRLEIIKKPDYERWGTTELDWVNVTKLFEYQPNQVAYAHSYLYCERAGKVRMVVDHCFGLKAWLNGKQVYRGAERAMGLGIYVGISRQKKDLVNYHAPMFDLDLVQGWNRLLVKVSSANKEGWREMQFAPRVYDAAPVYAEKNIVWMTELPERSNASAVIVDDRIFLPAEPDELLCLDKKTGKILWRAFNSLYDATPEADRAAYKDQLEPLARQLAATTDYEQGLALRRKMRDTLMAADLKNFKLKWDGHLESHFGIVGFTTTPVSDGRHVWAFFGNDVVACYDLDGRRQWIRRIESKEIVYSCSPALIGGKLMVVFGGLHALDAATGKEVWAHPEAHSMASLIPATIRGTDVVITRQGEMFRASDGLRLWANPHIRTGDTGWGAGVVIGDVFYLSWNGITGLIVADFAGVEGESWKPAVRFIELDCNHRRPNGEWLDRATAGSPLIYEGRFYGIDQYGVFYAVDLASGKTLYRQDIGFDEMHSYNHIGVGASATLGGKRIYVIDNQGVCAVLEPGPAYKPVAVNRIQTTLPRVWPIPPQEVLANGAPVFDGGRMYLRGEQYLYCIGAK
jgi:outer membrane protein assembly factor BamB